jgi:hypothetical protein
MDECILVSHDRDSSTDIWSGLVPLDGEAMNIVDNVSLSLFCRSSSSIANYVQELNAALFAPLPVDSRLVAVLDTCHSGSLLGTCLDLSLPVL